MLSTDLLLKYDYFLSGEQIVCHCTFDKGACIEFEYITKVVHLKQHAWCTRGKLIFQDKSCHFIKCKPVFRASYIFCDNVRVKFSSTHKSHIDSKGRNIKNLSKARITFPCIRKLEAKNDKYFEEILISQMFSAYLTRNSKNFEVDSREN